MPLRLTRPTKVVIHVLIGLAVVASGVALWFNPQTNMIQGMGKVEGGSSAGLSQGYAVNIPYQDILLVIQCKSVYAVQVWLLTSENYAMWQKSLADAKPLTQDLGTDITISTTIKNSGSYVVVVGKAAGYVSTSYSIKISLITYPYRVGALVLMIVGFIIVALRLVSQFYVVDLRWHPHPSTTSEPTPTD